ncbi:anti-sigma B factor RsbW [Sporolactobacillus sp. CQH2019]|uniref:anti-sigma B factor RsbW n=1 Tax=Sporolactobacillus sp. CQH2019 TaxID=3023512 RepID=UPI002367621D|nr:anti-sigma B factor RsbW [Sporolactobacillus sp. CQH2019]MDD9150764.1 anti-sigma B factor RsbW [Sporolactobacillus sp. CQH2019]
MDKTVDIIKLTIPAKPEYVCIARLASSGAAYRLGYPFDDIEDIKIAVSEACTNVVNHAYKHCAAGNIRIMIECRKHSLSITVIDTGNSFNLQKVLKGLRPLDASMSLNQVNEGGMGLFLIDSLMDEVTISSEFGVVVKMIKFLKRDGVERSADKVSTATE